MSTFEQAMAAQLTVSSVSSLSSDELNNKKTGFIEVVNDDDKQTITQDLAELKSSSSQKKEVVANVFQNFDALTGDKIDDYGVVHSQLEPISEKAPEAMQSLAEGKLSEQAKTEKKEDKKDAKAEAKKEDGNETKKAPPVKFGPRDESGTERSRRIQGYAYDAVTKDLGYDYNRPWKNKNPYYVEPEPSLKEKKFCKAPAAGKEAKEGDAKDEKKEEKKSEKKEEKKEAKAEAKKEGAAGDAPAEGKASEGTATAGNSTDEADCIPLPAAGNATNASNSTEAAGEAAPAEAAPAELLAKRNLLIKNGNATNITLKQLPKEVPVASNKTLAEAKKSVSANHTQSESHPVAANISITSNKTNKTLAQTTTKEQKKVEKKEEAKDDAKAEVEEKPWKAPTKGQKKQDIKEAFSGHLKPIKEEAKEGPPVEKRELSKAELQHKQDIKEAFTGHLPNDAKKIPETGAPVKIFVPEPKGELSPPTKSLKGLPPK